MKCLAVLVLCFVGVLSEGGYEPSGWKPQGALLAQQTLYGPPQTPTTPVPENTTAAEPNQDGSDLEKVNENIMERLRQEQGADFGSYYVYLPDGRLQKVQYTTAPLRSQTTAASSSTAGQGSYQNNQQVNQQAVFGSHQVNTQGNAQSFGRYSGGDYQTASNNQDESLAARLQASGWSTGNPAASNVRLAAQSGESDAEQISSGNGNGQVQQSNYVASVQFTDVQPIPGPIYTLNSSPLVRIVRYAPYYQ